jgi:hypothetical protein
MLQTTDFVKITSLYKCVTAEVHELCIGKKFNLLICVRHTFHL